MKKILVPLVFGLALGFSSAGCLNLNLGGGTSTHTQAPTVGQQLIDLQKARDSGAINDAEYQAQKAKILNEK